MLENASTTRKPSPDGPRHQQPAIIGSKIERGISRAAPVIAEAEHRPVQATADPTGPAAAAPDR